MTDKFRFTVLEGGRDKQPTVNTVKLAVIPVSTSPLPVEVRVFEEDTHLVLTVDPVMRYTEEHPVRLMTRVLEAKPKKPGSIVTNNANWYAVVHDLDADPTWRREWISQAYRTTLTLAEKKMIGKLGLPLLGSVHGKLSPGESLNLLIDAVKSLSFQNVKKILIPVPQSEVQETTTRLQNLMG
jgi:hypothetical protein